MRPVPLPRGAAIPIKEGHWEALVHRASPWFPPSWKGERSGCLSLDRYYMELQQADRSGSLFHPDPGNGGAASGERLCIHGKVEMHCPAFPPPFPARSRWDRLRLRNGVNRAGEKGYTSFLALLAWLAPHLEDALVFVADESDFLDSIAIHDGGSRHKRLVSGRWFDVEGATEDELLALHADGGDGFGDVA